jgi:seryl-tRNA(Sec) selenium transferase
MLSFRPRSAMKQSDPLLPLPSLGELLKHPTVERVVKRVNQTTVAQRAAGFLEELRTSLSRRDVVPSIHHLAERLARRLLGGEEPVFSVINATGVVWGDQWPAAPLAEAALEAMLQLASEYYDAGDSLHQRVVESLCALTGAESAWIAHSFAGVERLAREYARGKIDLARCAGLIDPAEWGLTPVATIKQRLAAGAEAVVVDGSGLLGGPRSGIVVGRRAALQQLVELPWANMLAADELTLAALAATLEIYRSGQQARLKIPALQLLSAPLENLQQRSERLAQLMAAVDGVQSAKPQAVASVWLSTSDSELSGPSWVIALKFRQLSPGKVIERWQESTPRLAVRAVGDQIHVDLRAVFPRWDQQLASAVENLASSR